MNPDSAVVDVDVAEKRRGRAAARGPGHMRWSPRTVHRPYRGVIDSIWPRPMNEGPGPFIEASVKDAPTCRRMSRWTTCRPISSAVP